MEKSINWYLEKLEVLEDGIDSDIEEEMLRIDISEVMDDPIVALGKFIETIERRLQEEYHTQAFKIGSRFAAEIRENVQSKNNE